MNLEKALLERSGGSCEICGGQNDLLVYPVAPKAGSSLDEAIYACATCVTQMKDTTTADPNHWRSLNDAMWSEVEAVKVVAYRMLHALKNEGWTADLLDMMYLEDETLAWAKEGLPETTENGVVHRDSNGVRLETGDSVVIIKDLNVKGSSLVAKRGTSVRNIRLVHDNPEHIEGKVDGQSIVILTKYVKK